MVTSGGAGKNWAGSILVNTIGPEGTECVLTINHDVPSDTMISNIAKMLHDMGLTENDIETAGTSSAMIDDSWHDQINE